MRRRGRHISIDRPSSTTSTTSSTIHCNQRIVSWNAIQSEDKQTEVISTVSGRIKSAIMFIVTTYFLPSGDLSPDYYIYARWRLLQRFVASTTAVFGTQSLLLALGFSKSSIGGTIRGFENFV
jgi:hypothetical protein